jgi:hypothetical protein
MNSLDAPATKGDLQQLGTDLRGEFRNEIQQLRTDLRGEMQQLRDELRGEMQPMYHDLVERGRDMETKLLNAFYTFA